MSYIRPLVSPGVATLLFVMLLVAFSAHAQDVSKPPGQRVDIYAGFSGGTQGNEYGWQAAVHWKAAMPLLGVEVGGTGFGFGQGAGSPKTFAYLVGPRLTVGARGVKAFAHALGGQVVITGNQSQSDGIVFAVGGGVDFPVFRHFKWRGEGDFLVATSLASSGATITRYSTGPVFRF